MSTLAKNRLSNMEFDFVSLVAAGDDPLAQVVISKADPDHFAGGKMPESISKDDLAPEVVEYIDALEIEVDTLAKSVEDETKAKDEALVAKTAAEEALAKAETEGLIVKSEDEQRKSLLAKADPAVRALIEKAEADAAEAGKIAKAERDARLDREFLSKAEAMPMISEEKTQLGALLRRISDALSPEDTATVEKMLSTANAEIAKGAMFSEFGVGGGETTISKSVVAAAEEIRKADPSLTMEQATAKAYEVNPSLLAEAMTGEGR